VELDPKFRMTLPEGLFLAFSTLRPCDLQFFLSFSCVANGIVDTIYRSKEALYILEHRVEHLTHMLSMAKHSIVLELSGMKFPVVLKLLSL